MNVMNVSTQQLNWINPINLETVKLYRILILSVFQLSRKYTVESNSLRTPGPVLNSKNRDGCPQ